MHERKLSDKMSECKTYFEDYDLENLVNNANKEALAEVRHHNVILLYIFFSFQMNLPFLFVSLIL